MGANSTDGSENNLFDHWVWSIDWSDHSLFPPDKNSDEFITATIAIITFVLFILPGYPHPLYYVTTCGILGKMYSNTMMVILNNRIVLQAQDESIIVSDEYVSSSTSMSNPGISQRPAFSTSQRHFGDAQFTNSGQFRLMFIRYNPHLLHHLPRAR